MWKNIKNESNKCIKAKMLKEESFKVIKYEFTFQSCQETFLLDNLVINDIVYLCIKECCVQNNIPVEVMP